jgi:hypothetical protein
MELKKLSDIRPLDRHRVEDAAAYTDPQLAEMLKDIFGLTDIPGTTKKLKAKELYLLAFGPAKKPLANLPVLPPPVAAPAGAKTGGAATGAVQAPQKDGNAGLTDKEIIDLNRRFDLAEKNGPPPISDDEPEEDEEPEEAGSNESPGSRTGYHATNPEAGAAIRKTGFRAGTKPGRLGGNGTYVNNTQEGAIAEFSHHNPGATPDVLTVRYNPGVEAVTKVAPRNYVMEHPLNVESITSPSVRAPGTFNTNILNGSMEVIK